MKLFLLVVTLAISHIVFSQPEVVIGEWAPVDLTTLNTASNFRDALNLGVQQLIARAIEFETLPAANYYIEDVLSIERRVVFGSFLEYKFNVIIGDNERIERELTFVVREDLETGRRYWLWSQPFEEIWPEDSPFASWEAVAETELETNRDLNDSLNYGIQDVISKGIELGQLSTPDYHWSEIYSIKRRPADDGMYYRFNVKLQNDQGGYAHVIFVVHSPSEGPRELLPSYLFFDIQSAGSQPNEETSGESSD